MPSAATEWSTKARIPANGPSPTTMTAMIAQYWDRATGVPGKIDRFIAPSAFLKGKLAEGKIPEQKIEVIPNFTSLEPVPDLPEGDYFVYIGRLLPEKGIDLLIRAAGNVEGARCLIVGEGPGEEALRKEAGMYGSGRVEFTGYLSGDDYRRSLSGARFVVVPSRWYENLPFAVMEAMAAGKPVIAADIGGIPEMVDGETGMLFPVNDGRALQGCIEKMNSDAGMRADMGRKGREKAERLYDSGTHYDRIMGVYDACKKARR